MKKTKLTNKILLMALSLLFLNSCAMIRRDKSWNQGQWKNQASQYWNDYKTDLSRNNITLRKPRGLTTRFRLAEGTLGRGDDRFPYVMLNNSRVGGWLIGSCNNSATTYMVKEANGFWNWKVAKHEVGHHADNHALCHGGHPTYMRNAGAPHWPYWVQGRSLNEASFIVYAKHIEIDNHMVCIFVLEDENDMQARSFMSEEEIREKDIALARELIALTESDNF